MGTKRIKLEEGQVYAIPLPNDSYTLTQLYNLHIINSRQSQVTFGFFNYKFETLEQLKSEYDRLDLSNPFAIATTNGYPRHYGWEILGCKPISTSYNYKAEISTLGLHRNRAIDPLAFLEPFFGIIPWDAIPEELFVNFLLPNVKLGNYVKYAKDYSTEDLIKLLGTEHIRVKERLREENIN